MRRTFRRTLGGVAKRLCRYPAIPRLPPRRDFFLTSAMFRPSSDCLPVCPPFRRLQAIGWQSTRETRAKAWSAAVEAFSGLPVGIGRSHLARTVRFVIYFPLHKSGSHAAGFGVATVTGHASETRKSTFGYFGQADRRERRAFRLRCERSLTLSCSGGW